MTRYARQVILPEVGEAGQARLAGIRVLVAGAGGLAATALPLLAGTGIGALTIVDPDRVDIGNLHRQTLFSEADVGRSKAEVAAERCRALNGDIAVAARSESVTPGNVRALVAKADIVLDCADTYAASFILSDTCFEAGKPLISASVLGLEGYAGGFCGGAPSLRAVFPDAPESVASCATAGVLPPAVAILGAFQAQMALGRALGLEPSPLGQMVQLDARTCRTATFRFDSAPEPGRAFRFADPAQLGEGDLIVDLRGAAEAPEPIHRQALRIAPEDLETGLPRRDGRLALCCATGLRSWRAAERIEHSWPGEIVLVAAKTS